MRIKGFVIRWCSDIVLTPGGYRPKLIAAITLGSGLVVKYYDVVNDEAEAIDFIQRATIEINKRAIKPPPVP